MSSHCPFFHRVAKPVFAAFSLVCLPSALTAQSDPASRTLLLDTVREEAAVYAVGERGAILVSKDEASSWQRVTAPTDATLTAIAFAPKSKLGWVVGHGGTILKTEDAGKTWLESKASEDKDAIFLDVIALSETEVIAIGAFGRAQASWDGGKTWQPIKPTAEDQHLNKIARLADGSLIIAGERGLVARSTDSGHTWNNIPSPYEGSFFGVLPLQDGDFLLFGLRGNVFRGKISTLPQLDKVETGGKFLLAAALQLADGKIVLAGQARITLLSTDGGRTFARWDSGVTTAVAELLETKQGILSIGEAGVALLKAP